MRRLRRYIDVLWTLKWRRVSTGKAHQDRVILPFWNLCKTFRIYNSAFANDSFMKLWRYSSMRPFHTTNHQGLTQRSYEDKSKLLCEYATSVLKKVSFWCWFLRIVLPYPNAASVWFNQNCFVFTGYVKPTN